jgi:hypothetical protein
MIDARFRDKQESGVFLAAVSLLRPKKRGLRPKPGLGIWVFAQFFIFLRQRIKGL